MSGNFPPGLGSVGPQPRPQAAVINISWASRGQPGPTALSQLTAVKSVNPGPVVSGEGGLRPSCHYQPSMIPRVWSQQLIETHQALSLCRWLIIIQDTFNYFTDIGRSKSPLVTISVMSVNNPMNNVNKWQKSVKIIFWKWFMNNPVCQKNATSYYINHTNVFVGIYCKYWTQLEIILN